MALFAGDGGAEGFAQAAPREGGTSQAVRRRLAELWGLALIALGAALALALASYDAGDPSQFSAPGQAPVNWLGRPGAVLADPLVRVLGRAAWFLVLFPLVWGLRMVLHIGEERVWARLLLAPLAVLLGALFAATHTPPEGWPLVTVGLGGHLGDNGALALLALLPVPAETAIRPLSLLLGVATALVWGAALGATSGEVRAALGWMGGSLAALAGRVAARRPRPAEAETGERDDFGIAAAVGLGPAEPAERREPVPPAAPAPAGPVDPEAAAARAAAAQNALGNALSVLSATPARPAPAPDPLGPDRETAMQALLADPAPRAGAEPDGPLPPRAAPAEDEEEEDETLRPDRREPAAEAPAAPAYDAPPLSLLQAPRKAGPTPLSELAIDESARQLETVLADYGVRGEIVAVKPGPVVTLYELEPAPGLKAARVIGLADDIARSMAALSARVSTVPGRSVIGIELPNAKRETVWLREVLEHEDYAETRHALALALGKTIEGQPCIANLAKMPHLLIAGTTGSGKSVAINTMILSLLYRLSPEECRLIMIDPKMLELSVYDGIPHLLAPVVTDPKKALVALKWVVGEMEERYRKMSKMGVRNIDGYNARVREALSRGEQFERTVQTGFDEDTGEPVYETETIEPEAMPLIVVIVDEMADLMMVAGKEIEACIQRLAQMARASGIHLIMATQRPSVDVITGTIKANFPTRISFQVTSKIDSRTILGEQGAEQLLGQGDMLYMAPGGRVRRVHGPFVSDDEVEEVVRHLKSLGRPDYVYAVIDGGDEETQALVDEKLGLAQAGDSEDALYDKAVAIVARDRKCSTSYIQRKLQIGYNKAARLVEEMETQGVVSPANAVGKREILIEER